MPSFTRAALSGIPGSYPSHVRDVQPERLFLVQPNRPVPAPGQARRRRHLRVEEISTPAPCNNRGDNHHGCRHRQPGRSAHARVYAGSHGHDVHNHGADDRDCRHRYPVPDTPHQHVRPAAAISARPVSHAQRRTTSDAPRALDPGSGHFAPSGPCVLLPLAFFPHLLKRSASDHKTTNPMILPDQRHSTPRPWIRPRPLPASNTPRVHPLRSSTRPILGVERPQHRRHLRRPIINTPPHPTPRI